MTRRPPSFALFSGGHDSLCATHVAMTNGYADEVIHKPWDWWVFCVYVPALPLLAVVGAITPGELRVAGELVGVGDDQYASKQTPALRVKPDWLVEPGSFARELRAAAVPASRSSS
jgi:hypothetical protein